MRVEIATQGWGWVADANGNGLGGQTVQIKNLDGTSATHWDAVTGGSSSTGNITTNSDGTIPRFIGTGTYTVTIGASTHRVEALDGVNAAVIREAPLNVQYAEYGAAGDGSTDDTTAIAAANSAAHAAGGGMIYVPAGTYMTDTVTLYDNITWVGDGKGASAIKLKNGVNHTLFKTENFDTLTGSVTNGGPRKFAVRNLTLDGNKANNLTAGAGMQIYGRDYTLADFDIVNCRGKGLYSEWYNGGDVMESRIWGFKIVDCVDIGMHYKGPHDSVIENGQVIRCGNRGIWADTGGSGNFLFRACHVWGGGYTEGWYFTTGGVQAFDCIAEGASAHNVWIDAADTQWMGGRIFGAGASDTATCLRIGDTTTAAFPSRCVVKAELGSAQTLVNFNREGGSNWYELMLQPVATGTPMSGLPAATSHCTMVWENGAGNSSTSIKRMLQFPGFVNFSQAVAASTVPNNSIFLDSADNVLKQKNNTGTVSAI